MQFRWIEWNLDHIAEHGVVPDEAEWAVRHPAAGYPRKYRDAFVVWGQTSAGRWLQVAFSRDGPDGADMVFVFHARDLTTREKRRVRK